MLNVGKILLDGSILGVLISAYAIGLLYVNPRFALNDLPEDIQNAVPPLTKKEKRSAIIFGIPFILATLAGPLVSTLHIKAQNGGIMPFWMLFVHAYGVLLIINFLELLLADVLVLCTITPEFAVIPGTEGFAGYKDYMHQVQAHARAVIIMAGLGLILAGVAAIL